MHSAHLHTLDPQMEVANSVVWMFWCMERGKKAMLMGDPMNDVQAQQADKTKYSDSDGYHAARQSSSCRTRGTCTPGTLYSSGGPRWPAMAHRRPRRRWRRRGRVPASLAAVARRPRISGARRAGRGSEGAEGGPGLP
eukprot:SAG25_NODE_1408_length_3100_cov_1.806065_2_plen_138_part_00